MSDWFCNQSFRSFGPLSSCSIFPTSHQKAWGKLFITQWLQNRKIKKRSTNCNPTRICSKRFTHSNWAKLLENYTSSKNCTKLWVHQWKHLQIRLENLWTNYHPSICESLEGGAGGYNWMWCVLENNNFGLSFNLSNQTWQFPAIYVLKDKNMSNKNHPLYDL